MPFQCWAHKANNAAKQRGDRDAQHRHLTEGLERFQALDDPPWLNLALNNCGELALA